jgi:micrococcal nuclease
VKYNRTYLRIFFVILAGIFVSLFPSPAKNPVPALRETAIVSYVIDGDTIKVLMNGREDTIRLIGIDAPETVDPNKPVQCFGKEASAKAKEILDNKTIILESDPTQGERDKYGRLLRYVFLQDGTNFDKFMISEGFAYEYTYQNNHYKYVEEFKNAQDQAKENKKGLWSYCLGR